MNDASEFNLDRLNEAVKQLNSLTSTPVTIGMNFADYMREKKLQDVSFVCEAFSEMDDTDIKQVGRLADRTRHGVSVDSLKLAIGEIVCRGLLNYADKVAEIEGRWMDFEAQR